MKILKVALLAGVLVAGLFAQAAVAAGHIEDSTVLKAVSQRCVGGEKIDNPESGVWYDVEFIDANGNGWSGQIKFTIVDGPDGEVLAFVTDSDYHNVSSIIIAGGPTYSVKYEIDGGSGSEGGLQAPENPSSGKAYGVSHVCLYLDKKPG